MLVLLAVILEVLLVLIVFWLVHVFFTLIHELGHGIAYQIMTSDKNWYMTVNKGKKLFETKKLILYLRPAIGYCHWNDELLKTETQAIVASAGGPLITLVIILLFMATRKHIVIGEAKIISPSTAQFLLDYILFYNISMLIATALPIKMNLGGKTYISDGYHIKEALERKYKTR